MTFTRKNYEAIATILDIARDNDHDIEKVARELAAYFKSENPRFDVPRFLEACGFDVADEMADEPCPECGRGGLLHFSGCKVES